MQDTSAQPKKRGRPATGRARTPAQRSADFRARARTQVFEGSGELADRADALLLEGFGVAYRARLPLEVERIADELLHRLGVSNSVAVTENEPVTVTDKSVTVTKNTAVSVAVMENEPVTVTKNTAVGVYSMEVKRLALVLADRGEGSATIRAAIKGACGRTLDPTNFAKTLRRWRAALAGAG